MKRRRFPTAFVSNIVCTCLATAHAAEVSAVASGDWTTATTWSNSAAAAAGNNYTIDGFTVTSPTGSNTVSFAGDAITISKTGTTAGVLDLARLHASSEQIITTTLPPITLNDGSTLQFRASTGSNRWNLSSATSIAVSGSVLFNNTGGGYGQNINIAGPVSGSGLIEYKTANSSSGTYERTLSLNAANSTFSGNWFVQHVNSGDDFGTLTAGAANALGTGTVTLDTRARLRNNANNGFDSLTGITLNQSTSSVFFNGRDWTNASGVLTLTNGTAEVGTATLSIASMAQAAGTINLTVGGTTNGSIITSGNASFSGGSLAVTLAGSPVGKTFDLLSYGGNLTGSPAYTFTGDSGRLTPSFNNGSGTNDKVTLSFTGSVGDLVWSGSANNNWDNNSTSNFTNGGTSDVFRLFDNVRFDDTTLSNSPILVGTVSAGTVTFDGDRDYTLGGAGNLGGETAIVKNGSHSLTISNTTANTFTGDITVNAGILKAGVATALGAAVVGTATTINTGATLDVNGQNLGAELVKIAGTGVGGNGAIINSGAQQTQALRFVTLTGDATIGGSGRWDIRGNATATLTLNGHKLTKTGSNYVALVATNITNGDIDVNAGTLALSTTTTLQGSGTATVNAGGTLELGFGTVAGNITRNLVLNGGAITTEGGASAVNSNLSLSANSTLGGNGTSLTLNGVISESGGARGILKTGTHTLIVTNNTNSWSGGTVINNGILQLNEGSSAGSGTITIGDTDISAATHSLRLNGATISNNVQSRYMWTGDYLGTITAIGGASSTINGDVTINPAVTGSPGRGGHLASTGTGSVLRLMGQLNVAGAQTIITQRDGTVEYGGGGNTAFTLQVTNTARLAGNDGISTLANLNLGVSAAATFDLNGYNQSLAQLTRSAQAATVTNTSATASVLTINGATDHTYSGTLNNGTGGISLVKDGSSTFTLAGNNTYSGGTTVNQGALTVGTGGTLGANTGTLAVNNTNTGTGTGTILNLATGANTTVGSLSGAVATPASGINSATINTQAGRTFTVNQTTAATFAGSIAGTGNFVLGSSSTQALTLSGSNTYSGTTNVSAGTLLVTGSLGNTAVTVANGATFGGTGTLGGDLGLGADSFFQVVDLDSPLAVNGTITFGSGFGIANLLGLDWETLAFNTPYTLISTSQAFSAPDIANFGIANAADVGGGRQAYFQSGSLQVVVIPEPRAALLGGLGVLLLLRRRRA
jgi:fibronectin-binding autotransporter adhesin